MKRILNAAALALFAAGAAHAGHLAVKAGNQDVSGGIVTAEEVISETNGWLVVHRTDASGKPGPVVGHAPVRAGATTDVAAILTEPVAAGEMLMLMLHAEEGGMETGVFEYTLGAMEDGPVKPDGKLITAVITAE